MRSTRLRPAADPRASVRRTTRRRASGFTLPELLVVIILIGIATALVVPRFRQTPAQRAYAAARQFAADLETVRSRAMATASPAQMHLVTGTNAYDGFLDWNRDGTFARTQDERDSLGVFAGRTIDPTAAFGRGSRGAVPGYADAAVDSFSDDAIVFDARGLSRPLGTSGIVYFRPNDEPDAYAAVTVSGAGNVRIWRWRAGGWQ